MDESNLPTLASGKIAGLDVDLVVKHFDRALNLVTHLSADIWPIVQHTRNRRATDARQRGNVVDRRVRGGSIQKFFDDYKAKSNFNWGFIGFRGSQALALINNGDTGSGRFSASVSDMSAALSTFNGMFDSGLTPYKAALSMATQIIQADTLASSDTKYVVVFLSDGMPTDYPPGSAGDAEMTKDVSALTSILPGRVSFNTVYYGEVDASASGRLRDMSLAGGGEFLDTNNNPTGKSFYIADYINIPGVSCQ